MGDQSRSFLLLQGVSSPFFSRLATALIQQGHRVHKVSFNAGDVVYWLPRRSNWFKQDLSELPDFLYTLYAKHGITDQVVFGDRRPVHIAALEQARQNNVRNHVFEEGYFRPNLITLEQEGVNARSQLPRSPQWFTQAAQHIPPQPLLKDFRSRLRLRAMHDIAYQASGVLNRLLFSKYRSHHNMSAAVEYAGYIQRSRLLKRVFDITDTNTLQNWVQDIDALHPIDLLIANQGMNINIGPEGKGESWEQTNLLLDVNLRASMAMVHAALPGMRKRGRGQVVLISSLAAYFGLPLTPAYSASKAGLKAYGEGLRGWLAPEGVGVTVIMPGYVKSDMCDAMPGPKTLVWSPDKAAKVMKQGIDQNKARITFPFFVSFETWLLAVLPASWSLKVLKLAGYHV